MLLLVLLQILRRFKSKGFEFNLNKIVKHLLFKIKYVFPFLLLSMSYSGNDTIKEERIAFEIINKDKPVGYIIIEKETNLYTETWSDVQFRYMMMSGAFFRLVLGKN